MANLRGLWDWRAGHPLPTQHHTGTQEQCDKLWLCPPEMSPQAETVIRRRGGQTAAQPGENSASSWHRQTPGSTGEDTERHTPLFQHTRLGRKIQIHS